MLAALLLAVAAAAPPQTQTVQVTVPRANVRAEPSERAPILQQVTPKDQIEWRSTDGDWFRVLLPPNPALGGARVEAYISKKVSRLSAPAVAAASPSPTVEPAAPVAAKAVTVFLGVGAGGVVLTERTASVAASGNRDVWTIDADVEAVAASAAASLDVSVTQPGPIDPGAVAPLLVKLSGVRGDAAVMQVGSTRADRDWKADEVGTTVTEMSPGVWHVVPDRALKAGAYAVVLRPTRDGTSAPKGVWAFQIRK
jgi:hypothetical protein